MADATVGDAGLRGVVRTCLKILLGLALATAAFPGPVTAQGTDGPAVISPGGVPDLRLPPVPDVPPVTALSFSAPLSNAAPALAASPEQRKLYLAMITREAERRGLPPALADAVATVESSYRTGAVGTVGEVGLMQVRPATAAMLGYRGGVTGLFAPEVNIQYGVTYLAEAWRITGGQLCETVMKYRAGHGETRMTQRSVEYCARVRQHLAALGSPLAQAPVPQAVADTVVPAPRAARPGGTPPRRGVATVAAGRKPLRTAAVRPPVRRAAWAAHDARFKAIQSKVSAASLRIMQ